MTAGRRHPATEPRTRPGPAGLAGWGLALAYLLAILVAAGLDLFVVHRTDSALDLPWWEVPSLLSGLWMAAAPLVGAVIVSRRPRQPVGWLLIAGPLLAAVAAVGGSAMRSSVAQGVVEPPVPVVFGAWVSSWVFGPIVMILLLVLVLFPDGAPPSPRWRPVVWAAGVVAVQGVVAQGLVPDRLVGRTWGPGGTERMVVYDVPNPFAVPALAGSAEAVLAAVGGLLVPLVTLAAVAAPIVRFRRARGTQRRQIRWLALAAGLLAASLVLSELARAVLAVPAAIATSLWQPATAVAPIAIGIAILRHGLYDIDRIISRTVTYGAVVGVLGACYAVVVVSLGAVVTVLTGQEGGDLPVAGATLVVVLLFGRVRARVQRRVERRFNRTGSQARSAVETFTDRVRDDVDPEVIRAEVAATATAAVQPDHASVWLAPRDVGGRSDR